MKKIVKSEGGIRLRRRIYKEYLLMKFAEADWHGVADCAMDLRELDVETKMSRSFSAKINKMHESILDELKKRRQAK